MTEINKRWQRDNILVRRLTVYGGLLSAGLWPISYYTSFSAATQGQGQWFSAVSVVTLLLAIGVTIGTAIGPGHVFTDEPPLEGSNGY